MIGSKTSQIPPYIILAWQSPQGVHALMTTRLGGVSPAPYGSMNLGSNTIDLPQNIAENKRRLQAWMTDQCSILSSSMNINTLGFLKQVNGVHVINLDDSEIKTCLAQGREPEADACYSTTVGMVCIVRIADCMPILLTVPGGVAAVHAGWRGLAGGTLCSNCCA